MNLVSAIIELEVPEYQIDQPVTVYFKDTMRKFGICSRRPGTVNMSTCDNCGLVHPAEDRYCPRCGETNFD